MASKKREKRLKKLCGGHPWLAILLFFVSFQLFMGIFTMLMLTFFYYAADNKLSGEYKSILYMAVLYGKGGHNDATFDMLNEAGRDYVLRDANGDTVYTHGEDSIGSSQGILAMSEDMIMFSRDMPGLDETGGGYRVYTDKKDPYIYLNDKGLLRVRDLDLRGIVAESAGGREIMRSLDMPLWISIDLSDGGEFIGKAHIRAEYRDIFVFLMIGTTLTLIGIVAFIVMIVSVIKNILRQRRLKDYIFTDEATEGRNWTWFLINGDKLLGRRRNAGKRYAIMNMSLVNYSNYVMCHSVAEGDELLRRISFALGQNCNKKKEQHAHVGAGCFALLWEVKDAQEVNLRLNNLLSQLSNVDSRHKFNFQIGVDVIEPSIEDGKLKSRKELDLEAEYNNAVTARETLQDNADSGVAFFDRELCELRKWEDMVVERQEQALAKEEFAVYYQPKYSPDTHELKGAEALIRWISPEFGFISPGRFIPIFEKNGFITQIDHYMIQHVAADQRRWLEAGLKCVPVSVNVSRAHFVEDDLAEQIRDMIDAAGCPREMIEIELTESAFFDDKYALVRTLEKLKGYGFSVSMDDFGSGYSSLNSLKDMALDVLKLDAEFFHGEADEERKEIVVGEAIRLAKSLNMRTVAEGVEEKEQVDFLAAAGCDMIQGFYFARPEPKEDYAKRLQGLVPMGTEADG